MRRVPASPDRQACEFPQGVGRRSPRSPRESVWRPVPLRAGRQKDSATNWDCRRGGLNPQQRTRRATWSRQPLLGVSIVSVEFPRHNRLNALSIGNGTANLEPSQGLWWMGCHSRDLQRRWPVGGTVSPPLLCRYQRLVMPPRSTAVSLAIRQRLERLEPSGFFHAVTPAASEQPSFLAFVCQPGPTVRSGRLDRHDSISDGIHTFHGSEPGLRALLRSAGRGDGHLAPMRQKSKVSPLGRWIVKTATTAPIKMSAPDRSSATWSPEPKAS